jgi:hypothetical protein
MRIIKNGIKKTLLMIVFLLRLLKNGAFRNPIKKTYSGTVAVLANGPSLKEDLPKLLAKKDLEKTDYIVMNFFAFDPVFFQLKPHYYCLADGAFFRKSLRIQDVMKLYDILQNEVDWKMNLYIPKSMVCDFITFSKLLNENITVIGINTIWYTGYECFRNFFYQKGFAMPEIRTVAALAIYVGINSGYSKIFLYGVDHTFFDGLLVNEKNQLCYKDTHFYDKSNIESEPIIDLWTGGVWKISDFLLNNSILFKSHDLLSEYAKYLNVEIINCTDHSLIDSYKRKSESIF